MRKNLVLAAILGLVFAGCSTPLANFSFVSTGSFQVGELDKGEYIEGSKCVWNVFGIPFGSRDNWVTLATSDALEQASKQGFQAEALTNVQVYESSWSALLFGANCMNVKGQPVIKKQSK